MTDFKQWYKMLSAATCCWAWRREIAVGRCLRCTCLSLPVYLHTDSSRPKWPTFNKTLHHCSGRL